MGEDDFSDMEKETRIKRFNKFLWGPKGKPNNLIAPLISVSEQDSKWAQYCSGFEEASSSGNNFFTKDIVDVAVTNKLTDIKVLINGTEIQCHSLFLRAYIKMFRERQYAGTKILLKHSDITEKTFFMIYQWITNMRNKFTAPEIISLYGVAKELCISELENFCLNCLTEDDQFRRITSFRVYTLACRPQTFSLAQSLLPRVSVFFLAIVTTIEFAQLNVIQLIQLISSPNLTIQSEIEVFYAVILWISIKFDKRQRAVDVIMRFVKFEFIPPLFLIKILMSELEPIVLKCITPYILNRAEIGLRYQLENSYPQIGELISWSPTRFWIIDLHCPYVEKLETGDVTVSFSDFISYLQVIHEMSKQNTTGEGNHGEAYKYYYDESSVDYLTEETDNLSGTEAITDMEPKKEDDNFLIELKNDEGTSTQQDDDLSGATSEVLPTEGENDDCSEDLIIF